MAKPQIFGKRSLCGVIAARTARDAWRQFERALQFTDVVELRLDWLADRKEVGRLLSRVTARGAARSATIIATCRRRNAGGRFAGTRVEQLSLLRSAVAAGCNWIDVEVETARAVSPFVLDLYTTGAKRIVSHHDFRMTPNAARLARLLREMEQLSGNSSSDAFKIATKCQSLADGLRLFDLADQRANVIAVPMGDVATPLRILAARFGSALSYAPVEQATAPGQISLSELHSLYRSGDVGSRTRIYAVIGNPVAHSLSPVLHNTAFRARKVDAIYLPFLVADLKDFLRAIEPLGIAGFSITLPHKERVLEHLDHVDALAASIGAVNTVVVKANGKLFGYNTDCLGILRALEGRWTLRGSRVLILGAGGAARAAAFALAQAGAKVSICSRRPERARKLARAVQGEAVLRAALRSEFFDMMINATPVGMHPRENESPLAPQELNCGLAFDTVYRPKETKFLRLAAKRGIKTVSGLEMFLAQGIAQWELWMGQTAPVAAMRRAVLDAVAREERKNQNA